MPLAAAGTLPGALIADHRRAGRGQNRVLSRALPRGGCTDPVSSPTFRIVNYYRGPRHASRILTSTASIPRVTWPPPGFYDYLDMGAVVACEWSENCAELLDLKIHRIRIERVDETTRKITIAKASAI